MSLQFKSEVREEVPGLSWEWVIYLEDEFGGLWEFDHSRTHWSEEAARQELDATLQELSSCG